MKQQDNLEFRGLTPEDVEMLSDFFDLLRNSGVEQFFHPHPLTKNEAFMKCNYGGKDVYYILVGGTSIIGYGLLRGWDEGYEIPSLGIAIHPDLRGNGYGRLMMYNLHAAAQWRGAQIIRLKVNPKNISAKRLYQSLGYRFDSGNNDEIIGLCNLPHSK